MSLKLRTRRCEAEGVSLGLGLGAIVELKIKLALDYVQKAKEVQILIDLLPDPEDVQPVVSPSRSTNSPDD